MSPFNVNGYGQLISIRHDLRNMLQTLFNQLHRHLSVIVDEDIRSRFKILIENNINDTLLVVGRHDNLQAASSQTVPVLASESSD